MAPEPPIYREKGEHHGFRIFTERIHCAFPGKIRKTLDPGRINHSRITFSRGNKEGFNQGNIKDYI